MDKVLKDINLKIDEILAGDTGETKVREDLNNSTIEKLNLTELIEQALLSNNVEQYEEYKERLEKCEKRIDFYNARLEQLKHQEVISEKESDKVFHKLFEYGDKLNEKYLQDLANELNRIANISMAYIDKHLELDNTMRRWNDNIHGYHWSNMTTYRETGTNHSIIPLSYEMIRHNAEVSYYDTLAYLQRRDILPLIEDNAHYKRLKESAHSRPTLL